MNNRLPLLLIALLMAVIMQALLSGCIDPLRPDNLEPTITMFPASEINRNEANVRAEIIMHGLSPLEFVEFKYCEIGEKKSTAPLSLNDSNIYSLRLSNLKPGTTYSVRLQTGTRTARILSDSIIFSTEPCTAPVVSEAQIISFAPLSAIVEFKIDDTGGTPILEAGCDIKDSAGKTTRIKLSSAEISQGKHRLTIENLQPLSNYKIIPFATNNIGESFGKQLEFATKQTISITSPGDLPKLFASQKSVDMPDFVISGRLNGSDFRFLRLLAGAPALAGQHDITSNLKSIDLSETVITEGGETYNNYRFTTADEITAELFENCTRLQSIRLPRSVKAIRRNAFNNCPNLETIEIGEETTLIISSDNCPSLKQIYVSKANMNYTTVDGALFDRNLTSIIWMPLGKEGTFQLPESITDIADFAFSSLSISEITLPATLKSIGRGAFSNSKITNLTLPDGVTKISESLCQNCSRLSSVSLGNKTNYIGAYAFAGTALKDIFISATIPPIMTTNTFGQSEEEIFSVCTLHVPAGSLEIYRNHNRWGRFNKIIEL